MKNNNERTPGEWAYCSIRDGYAIKEKSLPIGYGDYNRIAELYVYEYDNTEANASFIVKACNNYDSLLGALKECSPLLDGLINRTASGTKRNELTDINIKVKSAIKKTETN